MSGQARDVPAPINVHEEVPQMVIIRRPNPQFTNHDAKHAQKHPQERMRARRGKGRSRLVRDNSPSKSKAAKANPWIAHLKKFHAAHPKLTYAEAMKKAKATYKKH